MELQVYYFPETYKPVEIAMGEHETIIEEQKKQKKLGGGHH